MKKLITLLMITLFITFVAHPGLQLVQASNNNIEDEVTYTKTEGDKNYEYKEVVYQEDGYKRIEVKKYLITEGKEKELVMTNNTAIYNETFGTVFVNLDNKDSEDFIVYNDGSTNIVKKSEQNIGTQEVSRIIASNGSRIADYWYYDYDDRTSWATTGKRYKEVSSNNTGYRNYKDGVDNLRSEELSLISGGLTGLIEAVLDASKKGQEVTVSLVRQIAKSLGKAIPVLGEIWAIIDFISLAMDVDDLYDRILIY